MFDESSFLTQINPHNVQAQLPRLTQLPVIDQVAFWDITTLAPTHFNAANAYNTLSAYMRIAASYAEYNDIKPHRYYILKKRIHEDLLANYRRIAMSLFDKGVILDEEAPAPNVIADNLTKYLITDVQVTSEIYTLVSKLAKQLS
jgi:hypothetical protein